MFSNSEFSNFKFPDEPVLTYGQLTKADEERKEREQLKLPEGPAERNAVCFFEEALESESDAIASVQPELDDEFFNLTDKDLKAMHRHLKDQVRSFTERGFISKEIMDSRNKEAKLAAYRRTIVRFSVKHHFFVQAQFYSTEKVQSVVQFFTGILLNDTMHFELLIPPSLHLTSAGNQAKTLLDLEMPPKSMVFVSLTNLTEEECDIERIFKLNSLRQCTKSEADAISSEWLSANAQFNKFDSTIPVEKPVDNTALLRLIGGGGKRTAPKVEKSSNEGQHVDTEDKNGANNGGGEGSHNHSRQEHSQPMPKWFKMK